MKKLLTALEQEKIDMAFCDLINELIDNEVQKSQASTPRRITVAPNKPMYSKSEPVAQQFPTLKTFSTAELKAELEAREKAELERKQFLADETIDTIVSTVTMADMVGIKVKVNDCLLTDKLITFDMATNTINIKTPVVNPFRNSGFIDGSTVISAPAKPFL